MTIILLMFYQQSTVSQKRPASWIQQSKDDVEHPHHGPVAVTRQGVPVQCYTGTGRLACRAETDVSNCDSMTALL